MIKLADKTYAIRSIIRSFVDCEFTSVEVTLDRISAIEEIISLFPNATFVEQVDETFEELDSVRVSGVLNRDYDPDYDYLVKLYHQLKNNVYAIEII